MFQLEQENQTLNLTIQHLREELNMKTDIIMKQNDELTDLRNRIINLQQRLREPKMGMSELRQSVQVPKITHFQNNSTEMPEGISPGLQENFKDMKNLMRQYSQQLEMNIEHDK